MSNVDIRWLDPEVVEALLGDWVRLNAEVSNLSTTSVRQLLIAEVQGRRRPHYIRRLHGRYCVLRDRAEREALMRGELWPVKS